jgi:hypothetical protein
MQWLFNLAFWRRRVVERPRGQILVIVSIAMFVMVGAAALAVDIGRLWTTKRVMQSAADAAALAGADIAASAGTSSAVTSAALAAATQNGFTDGSGSSNSASAASVKVNYPPTSGQYKGNSDVVQVVLSQAQPTYFMGVLGLHSVPITVTADAMTISSGSCIYSLDPTGYGAMTVQGTASVNSSCGAYVNSNNSSALIASGNAAVSAPLVGVVGGTTLQGGGSTPITTKIAAFGDPLAWVPEPTGYGSCTGYKGNNVNSNTVLSPGLYCGGISLGGQANVTFSPGTYIIYGGGLSILAGAHVSGSAVTFYLTGLNVSNNSPGAYAGVNIAGGANVNLSAPCSSSGGGIEGMLFFQDRSISNGAVSVINGGANESFDGAIYFPTTSLTYSGTSGSNGYTLLVSYDLTVSGNATIGNNYSCLANGSLIKNAALVL